MEIDLTRVRNLINSLLSINFHIHTQNKLIKTVQLLSKQFSGALAYAELGTMNTSSGAEWAYFMDAFGSAPAFLFSWVSTLVLKPSQMAIICLSFSQYAVESFVSECDHPTIVVKMVALLAIGKYFHALSSKMLNGNLIILFSFLSFSFLYVCSMYLVC